MVNKVLGYRKMLALTQKEMADLLGISEGQYRAKEKGKYDFSQSEMKKFHDAAVEKNLDIRLEHIFF